MQALAQALAHPDGGIRASALKIVKQVPAIIQDTAFISTDQVPALFQQTMSDPVLAVRVASGCAYAAHMVIHMHGEAASAPFLHLIPAVLQVVLQACQEDESAAQSLLTALIELIEIRPKDMRTHGARGVCWILLMI
jgi:hypothetical protein